MVKNVPKSKKSIYFIKFYVLHLISLDFNSFLCSRRAQDGDMMVEYGYRMVKMCLPASTNFTSKKFC